MNYLQNMYIFVQEKITPEKKRNIKVIIQERIKTKLNKLYYNTVWRVSRGNWFDNQNYNIIKPCYPLLLLSPLICRSYRSLHGRTIIGRSQDFSQVGADLFRHRQNINMVHKNSTQLGTATRCLCVAYFFCT